MVRDQERIAFLTDTYATISNLQAYLLATFLPPTSMNVGGDGGLFITAAASAYNIASALERDLGVGARRFGQPGMPDEGLIAQLRSDLVPIIPVTLEMRRLDREGEIRTAAEYGIENGFEVLQAMQRDVYTAAQKIENDMRDRAQNDDTGVSEIKAKHRGSGTGCSRGRSFAWVFDFFVSSMADTTHSYGPREAVQRWV